MEFSLSLPLALRRGSQFRGYHPGIFSEQSPAWSGLCPRAPLGLGCSKISSMTVARGTQESPLTRWGGPFGLGPFTHTPHPFLNVSDSRHSAPATPGDSQQHWCPHWLWTHPGIWGGADFFLLTQRHLPWPSPTPLHLLWFAFFSEAKSPDSLLCVIRLAACVKAPEIAPSPPWRKVAHSRAGLETPLLLKCKTTSFLSRT